MTGWPVKTLGDVCVLVNGATPDTKVKDYWGGKHAWITPAEMGGLDSPFLSISRRTLSDKGLASCSATLVPPKTVILSSRAPIGHLVINEVPMATNQGCKSLIPKDGLDFSFLYYYLKANVELLESLGTGTTFKELSGTQLKTVEIPMPPLGEQKRIVELLDAATARVTELTACYEQARANANNLFTSALRGALQSNPDWPVKTLGDVVRFDSETARPEDLSSRDVYVGLENIASDGTLIGLGNVSAEMLKSNKARFTGDHILFGKLRPYLVKVVRPDFPGVCSTDILPIKPSAELSRDFLYWYMRSPAVIEAATGASTGTTLPRVSPTTLKSFEISVPPLDEQKRIVGRLDAMRAKTSEMVAAYDAKLQAAKNLRQSILESAFEGKL